MSEGVPYLQDRLNELFARIPPSGASSPDSRYTTNAAAREITERGTSITAVYLGKLRNGTQSNPSFRHLGAIADLFGVPVDYFHNETVAATVLSELSTLQASRDAQISGIMGRSHEQNVQFGLAQIKAIVAAIEDSQGHDGNDEKLEDQG